MVLKLQYRPEWRWYWNFNAKPSRGMILKFEYRSIKGKLCWNLSTDLPRGDGIKNLIPTSWGRMVLSFQCRTEWRWYSNFSTDLSKGMVHKLKYRPEWRWYWNFNAKLSRVMVLKFKYRPIKGDGTEILIPPRSGDGTEIWVPTYRGETVSKS